MRVKITIEYDPDWPQPDVDANTVEEKLESEKRDWRLGLVSISDVEALGEPDGKVTWEMIP